MGYLIVVLFLIKAKSKIFNENFVTQSELNQFILFMQKEFNKRNLGVVITHTLYIGNFNVNSVISITDKCYIDLNRLPDEIYNILTDESLILQFFILYETKRLEFLNKFEY